MTDIIPVKAIRSGADVVALGEYVTDDVVPIAHGGTGAATAEQAKTNLGITSGGSTAKSFFMAGW
jgi:hypothetical protein